jgi:predicted metal-dependent hydrolase
MLLPQAAAEYVIIRELAHLRERHHGPAFYALLRAVSPDHEAIELWLHMNAAGYTI